MPGTVDQRLFIREGTPDSWIESSIRRGAKSPAIATHVAPALAATCWHHWGVGRSCLAAERLVLPQAEGPLTPFLGRWWATVPSPNFLMSAERESTWSATTNETAECRLFRYLARFRNSTPWPLGSAFKGLEARLFLWARERALGLRQNGPGTFLQLIDIHVSKRLISVRRGAVKAAGWKPCEQVRSSLTPDL